MAINKHGLKIRGLLLTSLRTSYIPDTSPQYVQILYNTLSGMVWSVLRRPDDGRPAPVHPVVFCCATRRHMSRQAIADVVRDAVSHK